ncbi:nucleotidyl transferase AbiEii/AbiGii toxin family protein [Patescibacteria group bacterium]|nr:nucleotidyl transferase AbiEii/AbiGii toxin family protein [Patescibacteria group bacterium]
MTELTLLQKKVLDLFAKSSLKDKFYWTGGTLLSSYYLHHRRSSDLDFFTDKPFTYNQIISFIRKLKKELKLDQVEEKKIFDRQEFILHNKGKLRLEFVQYEHPKIKARKRWKGIIVDSLDDIAANKLISFLDRNDPKDLFDLYFLLTKKKYTIKKLIKLVEKKFGVSFEQSNVLSEIHKSTKELDNLKPLILAKSQKEKNKIIKEIQEYFSDLSNQYLQQVLK